MRTQPRRAVPMPKPVALECAVCGKRHDPGSTEGTCTCGGSLGARYDLTGIRPDALLPRRDLWRYLPLLPVESDAHVVSLGEGGTPLLRCRHLEDTFGVGRVFVKDESRNPTGTFKARGLSVAVSVARERGWTELAMPSAGNAGSALAAYAARASIRATVVMPRDTPLPIVQETLAFGARAFFVAGTIADAGRVVREYCAATGARSVATLQEPYRVEGKKTMGLEIWEELGRWPDWFVFPTGGGTGIVGLAKAVSEVRELGWDDGPGPKLCAVQAQGCAPIARAFEAGKDRTDPWNNPSTIAPGLKVPSPFGGALVLKAIRESDGTALAVSDGDMATSAVELGRMEGIHAAYEGGASLAGLRSLVLAGRIGSDDAVVLFNTGTGLKNAAPPRATKVTTVASGREIAERLRRAS